MKIAIFHYHLRRGGVTSVIKSTAAALKTHDVELAVISGEAPPAEADFPLPVEVVPRLNYLASGAPKEAAALAEEIATAARTAFDGDLPDVWHIHNHTLAKNVLLPSALVHLYRSHRARMLLQFHDFSEDSRPDNYAAQRAFEENCPLSHGGHPIPLPGAHFAALNQRDLGFLRAAGVPDSQLSALPNPVAFPQTELPSPGDRPFAQDKTFALYPTRAIRRKNLGELVLLAAMHRDTHHFATTLIPENEAWLRYHDHWADVIKKHDLPVTLGIGNDHDFFDLLGWSDALITTAVAEGFGLAFLEPWLIDKPLIGRDLPEITNDFGLDLSNLYKTLPVPADWIDKDSLVGKIEHALTAAYRSYHRELPTSAVEQTLAAFHVDEQHIDFGRLDEELQTTVIERALSEETLLETSILGPPSTATIQSNRAIAERDFNLESYGQRLSDLYQKIATTEAPAAGVNPEDFLDQFLAPERLNLLRTN